LTFRGGSGGNLITVSNTPSNGTSPVTTLQAGSGNDTVNVRGTTGSLLVNAGAGNDAINVGSTANTLDATLGPLTASGESQTSGDVLTINDQGATARTYSVTGTTVTRTGAATITYGTVESLVLNAANVGSGGNTINVNNVGGAAGTPVTVNPGNGSSGGS